MSVVTSIPAGDYLRVDYTFPSQWRVDTPDRPGPEGRGVSVFRRVYEILDDGFGGSVDNTIDEDAEYFIGATPAAAVAIANDVYASFEPNDVTDWASATYDHPAKNEHEEITVAFYGFSDFAMTVIRNELTN